MKKIENKELMQFILNNILEEGLLIQDFNGRVCHFNKKILEILDLSDKELLSKDNFKLWNLVDENFEKLSLDDFPNYQAVKNLKNIPNTKLGLLDKENKINKWIEVKSIIDFNKKFVISVVNDITNQMDSDIKKIYNSILDDYSIISRADLSGKITYVNKKFIDISGYSKEELIGQNHRKIKSKEHGKSFFKDMWETISSGKIWNGEVKNFKKNGEVYWVDSTIIPRKDKLGRVREYISFRIDITEKKEKQRLLEQQEKLTKEIFTQSADAMMTLEPPHWYFTGSNPATLRLFNVKSHEDFKKLGPWDVSPEKQPCGTLSNEKAKENIIKAMKEGSSSFQWTHSTIDGKPLDCEVLLSRIENHNKVYLQATVRDLTEKKELQRQLDLQKDKKLEQLHDIIKSSPSCLKILNKDGLLLDMNQRGLDLIEADNLESVKLANVFDLVEESHLENFKKMHKKVCDGENSYLVFEIIGLKGTRRWMETYAAPYVLQNGELGHIAITNEITDRIKQEQDLEEQKKLATHNYKLATIGEMAAGVGHEINNPLTIIKGNIQLINNKLKQDDNVDENIFKRIDVINESTKRITSIVDGLRSFARKDDEKEVIFNLSHEIKNSIDLIFEMYTKQGINISKNIEEGIFLDGNIGKIQQILMNLFSNAKDAMLNSSEKNLNISLYKKHKVSIIEIKDTGSGIPDEIKEKIYNPFFTTKEIGKGTGIGLGLVSKFIKEHGGKLNLVSKEGQGTSFIIELPPVEKDQNIRKEAISSNKIKKEVKPKKVLIAEDEEGIRELLNALLTDYNLELIFAEDGKEAIELLKKHDNIELILSDIQMPKVSGLDFLKIARRQLNYNNKFYFISGGVNIDLNDIVDQYNGFLNKPFEIEDIEKII